jgi:glycosyltransferase involved in cell wall biosynthesis
MVAAPKIIHLSSLTLDRGGTEHVILQITSSLTQLYNFDLVAIPSREFENRFKDICQGNIYKWGMKKILDLPQIQMLNYLFAKIKPNLVHIHDARAGLAARSILKNKGIPSLITVHLPPYYYQWKSFSYLRQLFYGWGDAFFNHATPTHIVYVAKTTFEYAIKKRYSPPDRSHVITNGIDLSLFKTNRELKKHSSKVIICCVARLSPQKNIPLLIQAGTILQDKGYDYSLWIIGDGSERDKLKELVKQNNLIDKVIFWGNQPNVAKFLQQSDIFVLPSYYETHPLAIMEAQAAGLPCVLSSVGDHEFMTSNPQCGYIFESGDIASCVNFLEKLIFSPELRLQLGNNAQKKAQQEYDMAMMIEKYDNLYRQLLNKSI